MCEQAFYTVTERFFGMLGLARRAGKTVLGTDMICERMRARSKPVLVLASREASLGTRNRLKYKCEFYSVSYRVVDATMAQLGKICGAMRPTAAVAITDEGFARELTGECQ